MINKQQTLDDLKTLLAQGLVQPSEIETLLQRESQQKTPSSFISLAYYLGALIIIAALIILLNGYWHFFRTSTKLMITALAPLTSYLIAISCQERSKLQAVATPFFIMFAVFTPLSLMSIFYELGYFPQGVGNYAISGLSFIACFWAFACFRRIELLVFSIFYGSLLSWSIIDDIFYRTDLLTDYLILISLGCCYAFILKPYWQKTRPQLATDLGCIGLFLIMFGILLLRNTQGIFLREVNLLKHGMWEVLMTLALIGNFYLATKWRNTLLIVIGALFLMVFLSIITSTYFSLSLGWPLSLLLLGLAIIVTAWGSWIFYEKKVQQRD